MSVPAQSRVRVKDNPHGLTPLNEVEIKPSPYREKKMICEECKQPVAEINFHGSCVAYCENWECPLYRQHEVTKVKVKKIKKRPSRKGRPSYKRWLKQRRPKRRERYHAIRSLGIGFKEALMFRDRTGMTIEDIKGVLKGE